MKVLGQSSDPENNSSIQTDTQNYVSFLDIDVRHKEFIAHAMWPNCFLYSQEMWKYLYYSFIYVHKYVYVMLKVTSIFCHYFIHQNNTSIAFFGGMQALKFF